MLTRAEHAQHQRDLQSNPWTTAFIYEVAPNAHGKMCSVFTQKFSDATVQCFSPVNFVGLKHRHCTVSLYDVFWVSVHSVSSFPQTISFVENTQFTQVLPLITQLNLYIFRCWTQTWNPGENLRTVPGKPAFRTDRPSLSGHPPLQCFFKKRLFQGEVITGWWLHYPPTLHVPGRGRISLLCQAAACTTFFYPPNSQPVLPKLTTVATQKFVMKRTGMSCSLGRSTACRCLASCCSPLSRLTPWLQAGSETGAACTHAQQRLRCGRLGHWSF